MPTVQTKITIAIFMNWVKFAIKLSVSYPRRVKFGFSIFLLFPSANFTSYSRLGFPNWALTKSSTSLETLYYSGIRSNCAFLIRIRQRFRNSGGNFRLSKGMTVMICRTCMSCQILDMEIPNTMHSKKFVLIEEVMTVWVACPTDLARAKTPPN